MSEHGTRTKYVSDQCRCEPCTAANRAYQRERNRRAARVRYGIEDPTIAYVDATEAREHLRWLSSVGVGRRRVVELTGLSDTAVQKIRTGRSTRCRPDTASKILAVGRSKAADGAYIDAKATWKLIDELVANGYRRTWIARQLGSTAKVPALQVGRTQVRADTARKVADLHQRLMFRVLEERRINNQRRQMYRDKERAAA